MSPQNTILCGSFILNTRRANGGYYMLSCLDCHLAKKEQLQLFWFGSQFSVSSRP